MSSSWRPRVVDLAALAGFTLLWLVPMAYVGFRGGPPAAWPTTLRDLYAVSCLFGRGSERVSVFYVQVRYADRPGWYDLDEREHFELEPFGHRTRFDRFMQRFGYQDDAELARHELGAWLAAAHATRHPERGEVVALRYLWADVEIRADRPPTGPWRKPPRAEAGRLRQLGETVLFGPEDGPEDGEDSDGGAR